MEKLHYLEHDDALVVETIYDASDVIADNARIRAEGPVVVGSKGQEMVLAMRFPLEHVATLKSLGYDPFSPDPDVSRRALLYVQQHQDQFLTTNKKMIAERKQKWR